MLHQLPLNEQNFEKLEDRWGISTGKSDDNVGEKKISYLNNLSEGIKLF